MALEDVEHCEDFCVHTDRIKKVNEKMPDEDELYDIAELFKVFGDSTRIRILYVLFESELCVCDLAETLHMNSVSSVLPVKDLKTGKTRVWTKRGQIGLLFLSR